MSFPEIVVMALGLAMDALAVAISCSIILQNVSSRQVFRVAFHFGLFQAMMPVLGWMAGISAQSTIEEWDHWIAFALLSFIGLKAIIDAISEDETRSSNEAASPRTQPSDPTRGLSLVAYSIATSIDALAVGVSLAAINVDIWEPALAIGLVTLATSAAGIIWGRKIGSASGDRVEIAGGIILIGLGLKILISHTLLS